MATLQIGEFVFGLANIRTASYSTRPVMDPSKRDIECVEINLEISGVVNQFMIASNAGPIGAPPGLNGTALTEGDRLPLTMFNLRDQLMQPRQFVLFEVAGQTVLESPAIDAATNLPFACDVKGGPFIDDVRYTEIRGDKTALLYARIRTYQSYSDNICLSNRWSLTSSTDDLGYTTRTTRGRAVFRQDAMVLRDAQPDDFRGVLILPCRSDMRRLNVDVVQNEAGDEVMYTVTDRQVTFGTGGALSPVLRIEGSSTAGVDVPIRNMGTIVNLVRGFIKDFNGPDGLDFGALIGRIATTLPTSKTYANVRVYGRQDSDQQQLANTAAGVLLDRLSPVAGLLQAALAIPVSCSITANFDSETGPWVEMRLEYVALNPGLLSNLIRGDSSDLMKIDTPINVAPGIVFNIGSPAAELLEANNTRTWFGRLVSQILLTSPGVPVAPPVNELAQDASPLV